MNLQDLMTKLRNIEEGAEVAPVHTDGDGENMEQEGIIIGSPMGGMMGQPEQPKQQDSVTMNVSMNGSGSGGIKDLMSILRNIENGQSAHHDAEHDHAEPLLGDEEFDEEMGDNGQTFGNSAHGDAGTHVHGVDAVTAKGNDMHSKGGSNPHFSPGNNTLRQSTTVHEGLIEKLHNLYNEVKTRDLTESVLTDDTGHTMQHILTTYKRDVRDFEESGEMSENLYDVLYDYYEEDMPYGVKKARDGDPYEWVSDRFASDLGMNETVPVDPMQGVAEGWQEDSQELEDWSKEVNKRLYRAHESQRPALARQLSKIEQKNFGSSINQGSLTQLVHSALMALQKGQMVHYDPQSVGQMPFGNIVGDDARIIASSGLSKYDVTGYRGLQRAGIVDTIEQFLHLRDLADNQGQAIMKYANMPPVAAWMQFIKDIGWSKDDMNEEVQAKTDDKLLAYYAQRKAEKEKQQQGVAEGFEQMPQNTAPTTPNMPTQAPSTFNYSALKSNPEWKKLQANLEAAINAGDPDSPALMKAMQDIKAFTAKMGVPSSK